MKFLLNKIHIPEIQKAVSVSVAKTAISATKYLRLKADGEKLYISACNFDLGYETKINAHIDDDGKAAIEADRFLNIIKSYPNDDIPIEVKENTMHIGKDTVSFSIKTIEYDDVPEPTMIDIPEYSLTFDKENLLSAISIAKSVDPGKDNTRPFTNMVFFRKTDGGYNILSTDSKRMTSCFLECNNDGPEEFNIPKTAVSTIMSNCDGRIFIQKNDVGFKTDGKLSVKQLEGTFPNVEDLLKKETEFIFHVNRKKLAASLKRCNIISRESKAVVISAKDGSLFLSASDIDNGDFSESIEIEEKIEFEVAVNSAFLLNAVNQSSEDFLKIGVTDCKNPLFIYSSTTFLIMPIKM